ncbi:MAG: hypothetical protein ACOYJB_06280 [Christensenellaceae bacterium]
MQEEPAQTPIAPLMANGHRTTTAAQQAIAEVQEAAAVLETTATEAAITVEAAITK